MSRKRPTKKPRPQLSANRIVTEALALTNKKGLEGLSFRNLANILNCEAMSLYHYFPSKAHLLDAMVAAVLAETQWADQVLPWEDRLRRLAREYRNMALRHPGFFPFLAVYRMNSEAGLAFINTAVEVFELAGLSPEQAARQFRVFGYYITGACLDESTGYIKGPSAVAPFPMDKARERFPSIIRAGQYFGKEHHQKTFETGVDALIAEIARQVSPSTQ